MKNNKPIKRREFLKSLGAFLAGIIVLPLGGRTLNDKHSATHTTPREAKFYSSGDHLTG